MIQSVKQLNFIMVPTRRRICRLSARIARSDSVGRRPQRLSAASQKEKQEQNGNGYTQKPKKNVTRRSRLMNSVL